MIAARAAFALMLAACGRIGFGAERDGAALDARSVDAAAPGDARPAAHWLVVADYDDPSGGLQVFAVDPTSGGLSPSGQGVVDSEPMPSYFAISRHGRHLYIPHETNASQISGFSIAPATGFLSPLPGSPFAGSGALNQIAVFDPGGTALFVSGAAGIQCYRHHDDGMIEKIGAPVVVPGAFQMAMDPLGRFLYAASYVPGEIHGFAVDAPACTLTSVGPPKTLTGAANGLHGIAIDPTGRYMIVLASSDASARVLAIAGDGALFEGPAPYPGGGRWVTFLPDGKRVLLADDTSGIWSYEFDADSGVMTAAPGAPFAPGPITWFVLPDAAGAHAYAADRADLHGFSIDEAGALVPLSGIPTAAVNPLAMGYVAFGD